MAATTRSMPTHGRFWRTPARCSSSASMSTCAPSSARWRTDIPLVQASGHASAMCRLALGLAYFRCCRNWWMLKGWAARSVLLLDLGLRQGVVGEFREDYRRYLVLCDIGTTVASRLRSRSIFELAPVRQLVCALEATAWHCTGPLFSFLSDYHARLLGTQIVEDGFRSQRGAEHEATLHVCVSHRRPDL